MTRRHGIDANTYDKLLLDSGAIYKNFTDIDNLGILLGATRGGAVFKREPKYIELPYEGVPGQVRGQKHLTGVKCSLEVSILSLDTDNIEVAIPNSSAVVNGDLDQVTITEQEWDAMGVHTLQNIAIVAELSGESDPVVIILDNPICESDFSLNFKDKSEAVGKWTFSAFYDETDGFDTPPWRVLWPGAFTITDIIETGSATTDYAETGTASSNIIESGTN